MIAQVNQANTAGLYAILDLHWSAPGNHCPMLQTQMADTDHSLTFWQSIANQFKRNPTVVFKLYNEPFMDGLRARLFAGTNTAPALRRFPINRSR